MSSPPYHQTPCFLIPVKLQLLPDISKFIFFTRLTIPVPSQSSPRLTPANIRTIPLTSKFFFYHYYHYSRLSHPCTVTPSFPNHPHPNLSHFLAYLRLCHSPAQSRSLSSPSVTIADNPCPYLITTCPELVPRLSCPVIIPAPSLSSAPVPLRPSPALLSHYCTIILIHHYSTMPSLPLAPPHPSATLLHSTTFHPLPPHPTPFHNRSLYPHSSNCLLSTCLHFTPAPHYLTSAIFWLIPTPPSCPSCPRTARLPRIGLPTVSMSGVCLG